MHTLELLPSPAIAAEPRRVWSFSLWEVSKRHEQSLLLGNLRGYLGCSQVPSIHHVQSLGICSPM